LRGDDCPPVREEEMTLKNLIFKKRYVPFIKTSRRYGPNQTRDHRRFIELVTNEASRQYTMEMEILLSAVYPR
jgi:hypothetical protein